MDLVIVDARQWQNLFDFRTGEKVDSDNAATRMVSKILGKRFYPGDMEETANRWVTDTALDLAAAYQPRLACLSYARQNFMQRITPLSDEQLRGMVCDVFEEIERFVRESGYVPVIIGTGDMTELHGEMDLSMCDGLVSSSNSSRYVGLNGPSSRDLDYLASLSGIERLVARDEWVSLFPSAKHNHERIPDCLLVAREGWCVRSAGSSPRRTARVQGRNTTIPVFSPLGAPASLAELRGLIEGNLDRTPVALIVIEGIGKRFFPRPFTECVNGIGWYAYEPDEGQYLTLTSGEHQVFTYPPGYRFSEEATEQREYPFSGHFREIPEHTLGADFSGRSIAVGNRSMFTHMVFGADISIECFSRNLFNQGCIAVLKEKTAGVAVSASSGGRLVSV
jgi:hypothetical protein